MGAWMRGNMKKFRQTGQSPFGAPAAPTPTPQTQPPAAGFMPPNTLPRPERSNVRQDIMRSMAGTPFGMRMGRQVQ